MVENLPANAGHTGLSPGLGRSHMPRSNWAREPQLLSLRVWSLCSAAREAAMVRGPHTAMKSGPHLPQLEKALAQKRRPNTAINKINKIKNLKKENAPYKKKKKKTNHKRLDNVLKEWPPLGGKGLLALGRCRAGRRKGGEGRWPLGRRSCFLRILEKIGDKLEG